MLFYQELVEKESASSLKQLYDTTYDALSSLNAMKMKTNDWGDILLFLVHSKLPLATKELWDGHLGKSDELPTFEDFMDFIETRFRTLKGIEATRQFSNFNSNSYHKSTSNLNKKTTLHTINKNSYLKNGKGQSNFKGVKPKPICDCCKENSHALNFCKKKCKHESS